MLGLTPLLYEGSSQAEFLKPTVITLVFGLGFGMVLVLVVVPALVAVQADVGLRLRALRRALRRGPVALRRTLLPAVLGLAAVALLPVATLVLGLDWHPSAGLLLALGIALWLVSVVAVAGLVRARLLRARLGNPASRWHRHRPAPSR